MKQKCQATDDPLGGFLQPLPRRVQLKSTRGSVWGPVNIFSL